MNLLKKCPVDVLESNVALKGWNRHGENKVLFQLFASLNTLKGLSKGHSLEWLGYHNETRGPEEPTSAKKPLGACV